MTWWVRSSEEARKVFDKEFDEFRFAAHVAAESLRQSSFSSIAAGTYLNSRVGSRERSTVAAYWFGSVAVGTREAEETHDQRRHQDSQESSCSPHCRDESYGDSVSLYISDAARRTHRWR